MQDFGMTIPLAGFPLCSVITISTYVFMLRLSRPIDTTRGKEDVGIAKRAKLYAAST